MLQMPGLLKVAVSLTRAVALVRILAAQFYVKRNSLKLALEAIFSLQNLESILTCFISSWKIGLKGYMYG